MEIHALGAKVIFPLARFGLHAKYFGINIDTLISSWAAMIIFVFGAFFLRYQITYNQGSMISYCTIGAVQWLSDFVSDSLGAVKDDLIVFSTTIFLYIIGSSMAACLLLKEATLDLNTDLAIAIIVFCYIQIWGLRFKGLRYFEKFAEPVILFMPLNIITQGSRILAICFRIFANVLSGALIWEIFQILFKKFSFVFYVCFVAWLAIFALSFIKKFNYNLSQSPLGSIVKIIALVPGYIFAGFIIFHGGIMQAGILMILLVNYLAIEVQEHD